MGAYGEKPTVFSKMRDTINANVGKTLTAEELLRWPERRWSHEVVYFRSLVALGYLRPLQPGAAAQRGGRYKVIKPLHSRCTVHSLNDEMRALRGLIPYSALLKN